MSAVSSRLSLRCCKSSSVMSSHLVWGLPACFSSRTRLGWMKRWCVCEWCVPGVVGDVWVNGAEQPVGKHWWTSFLRSELVKWRCQLIFVMVLSALLFNLSIPLTRVRGQDSTRCRNTIQDWDHWWSLGFQFCFSLFGFAASVWDMVRALLRCWWE